MKNKVPAGLGGWLILIQIGLWRSVLGFAAAIEAGAFVALNVLFLIATIILLIMLYSKHKKFPLVSIIVIWANWIFGVVVGLYFATLETFGALLLGLLIAIVWTAYLVKSKRVKNTFIR